MPTSEPLTVQPGAATTVEAVEGRHRVIPMHSFVLISRYFVLNLLFFEPLLLHQAGERIVALNRIGLALLLGRPWQGHFLVLLVFATRTELFLFRSLAFLVLRNLFRQAVLFDLLDLLREGDAVGGDAQERHDDLIDHREPRHLQ